WATPATLRAAWPSSPPTRRSSSPARRSRSTADSICTECATRPPASLPAGSDASSGHRRTKPMNAPRNRQYQHIEAHKIAGSLGAEVAGVDLSDDLPDDVLAEIRAALLDNCVIFFRDQKLTPEQQLRFAKRWGEIHLHPFMQGMANHPEI